MIAENRRLEREAATSAATAQFADPRQLAPASELRAQLETVTGQRKATADVN